MGVYFIAAGNSSNNRYKTLEQSHRVEDLVPHVPPAVAEKLHEAFPSGEGVYAWGGSDPRHQAVLSLPSGTYVVDVANATVRHVFRFAFGYRTPLGDHRIQNHFEWDDHVHPAERRPYPLVYFLSDRMPTSRTEALWFRRAFGIGYANWLPGQKLFSDREIADAMSLTQSPTVEAFLGIGPADSSPPVFTPIAREPAVGFSSKPGAGGLSGEQEPEDAEATAQEARSGQGRGLSAPERRAVERHAMEMATAHYEARWDSVRDVGATESYDLVCRRGMSELRVEVKGTTGSGDTVLLTRNEVGHARKQHPNVALFVVSGIRLEGRGTDQPVAMGGTVRVISPWNVDDARGRLEAETYRLTLPPER